MARIAIVYAPEPQHRDGGADVRTNALAREIGKHFITEIVVIGPGGVVESRPDAIARLRSTLRGIPPRVSQRYDPRVRASVHNKLSNADIVIAETLFTLPYLDGIQSPVVLDAHNVESEVVARLARRHPGSLRRLAYATTLKWTQRWELGAVSELAQVWAVSEQEGLWFRASSRDVVLVPNGVTMPVRPQPLNPEPSLIFVGSLRAQFNRDGLSWFLDRCWPTILAQSPTATLHVVGHGAEDFRAAGVVSHGFVADLEAVYRQSRIAIVPLLDGAGTRLKVLEAMAQMRPVVSTTVGVEGIDVVPGHDAAVVDDAPAFAHACLRLITDDALADRLSHNAEQLVRERYDWRMIGDRAAGALRRLLGPEM